MIEKITTPKSELQHVSIIRANPSDLEKVYDILAEATAWLASRGMNHWNGVHTKERIEADFDKSHVLLARDAGGTTVGTVTVSFDTPWYHQPSDRMFWAQPEALAAYVRKMAVIPTMMKKGIAANLLASAEQDGFDAGAQFARLDTNPAFPGLVRYYLGHGYARVGIREGNSFFEKKLDRGITIKSSGQ